MINMENSPLKSQASTPSTQERYDIQIVTDQLVDIDKVLDYAKNSKNDITGQQYAEFINNCLQSGNFKISSDQIISPYNGLYRNPTINSPAQYAYLKNIL